MEISAMGEKVRKGCRECRGRGLQLKIEWSGKPR